MLLHYTVPPNEEVFVLENSIAVELRHMLPIFRAIRNKYYNLFFQQTNRCLQEFLNLWFVNCSAAGEMWSQYLLRRVRFLQCCPLTVDALHCKVCSIRSELMIFGSHCLRAREMVLILSCIDRIVIMLDGVTSIRECTCRFPLSSSGPNPTRRTLYSSRFRFLRWSTIFSTSQTFSPSLLIIGENVFFLFLAFMTSKAWDWVGLVYPHLTEVWDVIHRWKLYPRLLFYVPFYVHQRDTFNLLVPLDILLCHFCSGSNWFDISFDNKNFCVNWLLIIECSEVYP